MILQIILTLVLLLLLYLIRQCYIIPHRTMKNYAKQLQQRGYRVLYKPYNPLYLHFDEVLKKSQKQGDSLKYFKQNYPNCDVLITNILNKPYIQLCHPDFIKDFYAVDKHYTYPKMQSGIDFIVRIAGRGLPFSEGKQWKHKRTLLNGVFNFQFVKSQSQKIAQTCDKVLQKMQNLATISQQPDQGNKYCQYNLLDLFVQLFSQIMLTSFLGMKTEQKIEGLSVASFLKKLVDDSTDHSFDLVGLIFGEKAWKLGLRKMDRSINRRVAMYKEWAIPYINNRIREIERQLSENPNKKEANDIIEAIILQKVKNNTLGSQYSSSEFFDEFTAFFFAGTDTTSNFTQMMIYYIVQDPQIQAKLRQEIEQFMEHQDYSYENLKNFKYIDNIQKETTRIYGPGIYLFLRQASQDNYINGLPIKKGTNVIAFHQGNHYSEQYFKEPFKFRPERWDGECNNIPAFVTGGFSAGARTCIGKHLALLQSKIALIKFMKRYKSIQIPKNFKMQYKFLPCPEYFKSKLILAEKTIK